MFKILANIAASLRRIVMNIAGYINTNGIHVRSGRFNFGINPVAAD